MPATLTYPGVYVEEIPSGVRTIAGVSTSIAMFIGRAKKGELNKPVLCLSFEDFKRTFSSEFANSDLARSVKLFFSNGGNRCFVMRIADMTVARSASVALQNEANPSIDTLQLAAKSQGLFGDSIRVVVDYDTAQPEVTFNLSLFRWEQNSSGVLQQSLPENHINLTMEPNDSRYAVDVINRDSSLVEATSTGLASGIGYSQSGFAVSARTNTIYRNQWMDILGSAVTTNRFMISVDGIAPREVDLSSIDFTDGAHPIPVNNATNAAANLAQRIQDIINNNVLSGTGSNVTVEIPAEGGGPFTYPNNPVGPAGPAGEDNEFTSFLRINSANGNVLVEPALSNDLAMPLMLGTGQGGVEVGSFAAARPAPTGNITSADDLVNFGEMLQSAFDTVIVDGTQIGVAGGAYGLNTIGAGVVEPRMYQDSTATDQNDGRAGVREKISILAAAINAQALSDPTFQYQAQVWGNRLAINPTSGGDNRVVVVSTEIGGAAGPNISANVIDNVRYYSLGNSGLPQFQTPGLSGNDGTKPLPIDYENAYRIIDNEVDLFNLLILPRDHENNNTETRRLWGPASVFCQRRRAFMLIDPPDDWTDPQAAVDAAIGVNSLRVGLVKNRSAVFYPNLTIVDNGKETHVGPSGAIAGLIARIDGTRGVWKASAGIEADLRGVIGVQHKFSDGQNGVLNPNAINTIRLFPNGIINWGVRTMDGADGFGSEWKYIPIVRTALYIEESLYRGLKWVVFEPNDEPLWAQVRLNVGAFMHNLFRQGAFQGQTPKQAYSVQCDGTTTTENDRNLGIVNIYVGFAPLKPAEFVVLHLQQLAGQVQV